MASRIKRTRISTTNRSPKNGVTERERRLWVDKARRFPVVIQRGHDPNQMGPTIHALHTNNVLFAMLRSPADGMIEIRVKQDSVEKAKELAGRKSA